MAASTRLHANQRDHAGPCRYLELEAAGKLRRFRFDRCPGCEDVRAVDEAVKLLEARGFEVRRPG